MTVMETTTVGTVPALAMPAGALRDMLAGALVAASKDSTMPTLTTVQLEWSLGEVAAVATDRYRLAVGTYTTNQDNTAEIVDTARVGIPRDVAAALVKALPKAPARGNDYTVATVTPVPDRAGEWSVAWSGPAGSGSITFRQLDGEFPKWRPLIPTTDPVPTAGISWNPTYMADVARIPHERNVAVSWEFRGSDRPAVATYPTHNGVEWRYLLMPVRLR